MQTFDVIVVGGGPAGSSCAWRLRQHGVDCLVIDQARFPRDKLCAGWVTPECLRDLALDPAEYSHGLLTFDHIRVHLWGLGFALPGIQHSIRRSEFDDWLLERSGAPVAVHRVERILAETDGYVIDERFHCRFLVGAGGTRCPVYRNLFKPAHPRAGNLQALALEQEFAYPWKDPRCQLWFFRSGLPGYAWYVPKAGGYLNIGIGAMSAALQRRGESIKQHWSQFTRELERRGLARNVDWEPGGYSYYLRDGTDTLRHGNALLAGDAAGLATRDLCEGIGPAVRSGLLAADAIATGTEYRLDTVLRHSIGKPWIQRFLDRRFTGGQGVVHTRGRTS